MSAIARRRPSLPYRKGWCPGALRPMETGDGLLARVRAPRGRLSLDQAGALVDAALRCGNGIIGLSARANLHLRGLSEQTLPDLQRYVTTYIAGKPRVTGVLLPAEARHAIGLTEADLLTRGVR